MCDLQQLIEDCAIRRLKRVRTRDLYQLRCFGKSVKVGVLIEGEAHEAEL
jgi:hypothetical protein